MTTLKTPKAALYVRNSMPIQTSANNLALQKQELVNFTQHVLKIDEYEIFEEIGYLAKDTNRPAYQQMLSQMRNGEFSHLCVWKINRISRNIPDFIDLYKNECKKNHVTFITMDEQEPINDDFIEILEKFCF